MTGLTGQRLGRSLALPLIFYSFAIPYRIIMPPVASTVVPVM